MRKPIRNYTLSWALVLAPGSVPALSAGAPKQLVVAWGELAPLVEKRDTRRCC
ncbi:MAG: hypothetical protein RMK57_11095 [Bryobacterales bacterium]|nr:hypothetical protein [Bryobacteraceae bacterium]MDW8355065.1 hypothetical protein [Bryobacterales bacterium]